MSGPKLVVVQEKSLVWYAAWIFVGLSLLVAAYFLGLYQDSANQRELSQQLAETRTELDKIQRAYKQANESLVMQAQTAKVDNLTNQQLVETVKQLQDTQTQLESELRFYRNIMAPELEQEGLTIAQLELSRDTPSSDPSFKLVLTQAGRQEQFLKGNVELTVHGKENDQPKVYSFRELGTFNSKHFQFQFRYFQNIVGELSLPEGFQAEFVKIKAKTSGLRKNQTAEKQVDWTI